MYTTNALIGQYLCTIMAHTENFPSSELSLFYKQIFTKWFSVHKIVIQTLGMLLDFRSKKRLRLKSRV